MLWYCWLEDRHQPVKNPASAILKVPLWTPLENPAYAKWSPEIGRLNRIRKRTLFSAKLHHCMPTQRYHCLDINLSAIIFALFIKLNFFAIHQAACRVHGVRSGWTRFSRWRARWGCDIGVVGRRECGYACECQRVAISTAPSSC